MLRPATPLTLLLLIAFVLLLLSVISTPIVNGIPLASFKGTDFGVFGYCMRGSKCPGVQVGYSMSIHPYDAMMAPFEEIQDVGHAHHSMVLSARDTLLPSIKDSCCF